MKRLLKNWSYSNSIYFTKQIKRCLICFGFLLLLFLGEAGKSIAQNLVPNPSIENYSQCPTQGQIAYLTSWYSPDNGAGYMDTCAPYNQGYNVPGGYLGINYQYAHTGSAYVGINALNANDSRNNIQVKLIDTLKKNHCYYVDFYVNLENSSGYAINNLAANFSKNAVFSTGSGSLL